MTPVKLAVVGGGVIGKRHMKAIAASDDVTLVAIVDPHPATENLANEASVAWYQSTQDYFAVHAGNSTSVDAAAGIIVATPTEHHLAPTMAALDAGMHVLVEKPVMATLDEATQVIERSASTGLHVLVGHQRRYYEQVHKTRAMIADGTLGKLVAVTGQWNVRKDDPYYDPDWRKQWKAGPVLTNLIHEMDYLRYMCGDVASISAETSNAVQGFEKEDVAAIVMRFTSGALGTFILSDQTNSPWGWEFGTGENAAFPASRQNALRFMGTRASLEFPNLVLWQHADAPGDWTQSIHPHAMPIELEDAYLNQIDHFAAVIRGECEPRISARDGAESLRATLAVYEAAASGQRVEL